MLHPRVAPIVAAISLIVIGCASTSPAPSGPPTSSIAPGRSSTASASPLATPSPTSSPSPSASFRVTGLELHADPAKFTGACPLKITFTARITVAGESGTVSYRWVSSDGDKSPTKTAIFTGSGSQQVTSDWTVDVAHVPSRGGWSSIEITDPVGQGSLSTPTAKADFIFACDDEDGFETIGFGLGGSDCSLGTPGRTFATTDPVWMVADYSPSLRTGTVVTFRLSRDGALVDGYPMEVTLQESTKCVHGIISPGVLPKGHYRLDVIPDTARPISGEFDTH